MVSSYALQTATTLFEQSGIKLSQKDMEAQLSVNESFYKTLLRVPVSTVRSNYLLIESKDIEFYCQEQVVNIIFADSNIVAISRAKQTGQSGLSERKESELNRLLAQVEKRMSDWNTLNDRQQKLNKDIKKIARRQVKDWKTLQKENVEKILGDSRLEAFSTSGTFKRRLSQSLERLGANVEFPEDSLKKLKIKGELTGVEKAVLSTLLKEADKDNQDEMVKLFEDIRKDVLPAIDESNKNFMSKTNEQMDAVQPAINKLNEQVEEFYSSYLRLVKVIEDFQETLPANVQREISSQPITMPKTEIAAMGYAAAAA